MQTRLDLPPAPKHTRIATQKPVNSLMKYLRIRKGDLPYAAGLAAGVISVDRKNFYKLYEMRFLGDDLVEQRSFCISV